MRINRRTAADKANKDFDVSCGGAHAEIGFPVHVILERGGNNTQALHLSESELAGLAAFYNGGANSPQAEVIRAARLWMQRAGAARRDRLAREKGTT